MAVPGLATDCRIVERKARGGGGVHYAVEFLFDGVLHRTVYSPYLSDARNWKRTLETFGWSSAVLLGRAGKNWRQSPMQEARARWKVRNR